MHKQTKAFLDKTIAEPKKKLTDIYLETKDTKAVERKIVGDTASRLYNSSPAQLYLKKHKNLAKKTKIELLEHARKNKENIGYARLANDISEQILDRTEGKPIQSVQTHNTNLNVNMEASKELSDNFLAFLKQDSRS